MEPIVEHADIEEILFVWRSRLGELHAGYRGHVYRVFNACLALGPCRADEVRKLAIAAAFHDLGIWSDQTIDYLAPSAERARRHLAQRGLSDWADAVARIIELHHRVRPCRGPDDHLVERFRRADLADLSCGWLRSGVPAGLIRELRQRFPDAGFHRFLAAGASDWLRRHPFRLPPFIRW